MQHKKRGNSNDSEISTSVVHHEKHLPIFNVTLFCFAFKKDILDHEIH